MNSEKLLEFLFFCKAQLCSIIQRLQQFQPQTGTKRRCRGGLVFLTRIPDGSLDVMFILDIVCFQFLA